MDSSSETREKVEKYMRMLQNEDKMGHALRRLGAVNMTLELLSETGVGKAVNQLRNHEEHGEQALRIVERWKALARSFGLKQRTSRSSSSSPPRDPSPSKTRKENVKQKKYSKTVADTADEVDETKKSEKRKHHHGESGNSKDTAGASGSSAVSFEEMLAMGDCAKKIKPKKMKMDPVEWKSAHPDDNSRPSKRLNFEPQPIVKTPTVPEAMMLDMAMFKPRKDARRVFAGRPRGEVNKEIPTLQTLCIRVLMNNIDAIEETGDVPFHLLKAILEKCSPEQLIRIEKFNPNLLEDSDCLWEKIVNRQFPNHETADDETWRECYLRLCTEQERRLKMLSSQINKHSKEASAPVRKALLADAKAPREVRKKQIRYGTGHVNRELPSASELSKARKAIFDKGNKDALANMPQAVRNEHSTLGSHSSKKKTPPAKKGALMVKTLKMIKNSTRR